MNRYQPIIGLEIHIELKTKAKMFCQCPSHYFGRKPNTQTCPVCLGLPGALPVPNRKAVEWTALLGRALNCHINKLSKFDRKHYFYPDLPKGYQISQYDQPIAISGWLKLKIKNKKLKMEEKKFRIRRVHLEEDTGKLLHKGKDTLIDFNRSGVPLVEIVTEPDFEDPADVGQFLEELQIIVRYLGISAANMEEGTMRLEPNISVKKNKKEIEKLKDTNKKPKSDKDLPPYKVEIKNINSFRFVKQAIDYEVKRQIKLLEKGEQPIQETRGFDEKKRITLLQRTKEEAHDYRYFPEPDIPPMTFGRDFVKSIDEQLPELPQEKLERYVNRLRLKYKDAYILTRNKKIAQYFEEIISKIKNKREKIEIEDKRIGQKIASLIVNKKISTNLPSEVFMKKALERLKPKRTDIKLLSLVIRQVIKENPKPVSDYKKGKENAIMYLVGQVMKKIKDQADAKLVRESLAKKLKKN